MTAQLLYEIAGAAYPNPDVTARFDTIHLAQEGPDRVRVSGVRGEPPPPTTKVCINYFGGYKNSMTFVLTGLDLEEKARLAEETLWKLVGGREQFAESRATLRRGDRPDPETNEDAFSYLTISVKDPDPQKVGRAWSNKVVEMALASYPGFFMTHVPSSEQQVGVYWPALVPSRDVGHRVVLGETVIDIPPVEPPAARPLVSGADAPGGALPGGPTRDVPLGTICGARSGDKGGNANVGVWARTPEAYRWLASFLTAERLRALLPEARSLVVERHELPNILAVNFVLKGLLGDGVAASLRSDPQAKSLGEYVRAKIVPVPVSLLA